jgi:transposase
MAYSRDLRLRVTRAVAGGMARRAAAERFGVSATTAVRWVQRAGQDGTPTAERRHRRPSPGGLAAHLAFLIAVVEAEPDITMPELAARLLAERGVPAHPASLSRRLCRAGVTYKKTAHGRRVRPPRRRPAPAGVD